MTAQSGWFTSERYGSRTAIVGSIVAFGVLLAFAGYTMFDTAHLMSDNCIGDTGQKVCSTSGPSWVRPLPAVAAVLGVLAGLAGVLAGRPVRTPALIAGFLLIAAGLAGSWLIG
jgi:hypothetical protein